MGGICDVDEHESQYEMLEYYISGGCAGLGNLYILTAVVMIGDGNIRRYKGLLRISVHHRHPSSPDVTHSPRVATTVPCRPAL